MGEPEVPTIHEFLKKNLTQGSVSRDLTDVPSAQKKRQNWRKFLIKTVYLSVLIYDLVGDIWENRPVLSCEPVMELDIKWAGESRLINAQESAKQWKKKGCRFFVLTSLDDIAWLLNIRGGDVHCCPVVLVLFDNDKKRDQAVLRKPFQTDVLDALEKGWRDPSSL